MAALQARRQREREAALVNCFDLTVTIAEPDRRVLLDVAGIAPERVRVVPNGVDENALCAGADSLPRGQSIIFWGNLDFPPNASAVRWFHRSVWQPHLAGRGLEWHIAGAGATADIKALRSEPGIILHGFVDDLYGLARRQGLMVNPMVEGSGLKNKVLESFAIGLPVVSTSMGMEAIDAEDGRYCRIADGPAEFAAAVLDLLSRPAHAEALSVAARQLVYSRYTWAVAGQALAELLGVAGDRRVQASAA
jgi:glycosyltransferase involved in cell wall biosynthesis